MQCIFLNAAGQTLFVRDDMESGHWTQEQMNITADFPFDPAKKIERGQRIAFRDPATDKIEVFEIRIVTSQEPEHYQQITAEHICVSELSDEHINKKEITDEFAEQALSTALTGTLWSVGTVTFGTAEERAAIQAQITALGLNGNVDLTNRPIISPETMKNAGYTDFDGDYATLYSMTYTKLTQDNQTNTLLMTPIKVDGSVLSQSQIDDYVDTLCASSANMGALKGNDTQGLLIHVLAGEQITAMDAIAESAHDLSDEWEICTQGEPGSADISRGTVWDAVNTIQQNWNVYITPRIVVSSAGAITGRYLDIAPAEGVWRGLRLSVRKNLLDPAVTYDDENLYTALYGYGGNVQASQTSGDDTTEELTFKDVVWTATADHPAKPADQTYLEWPEKTALYGRNGRPRYGYYQNGSIKDADILLEKTWESLKLSSDPKISISGTCVDLYRLGYKDQPLCLHDLVIVEIEETGETFQKQIICCDIDLIDPTGSRVEIGDYIPNIVYINRDTNEKASGGGGGGGRGSMTNLEDDDAKTFADFVRTQTMVGMVVGTRNGENYIRGGQITLAINEDGGTTATIQADCIDIDGVVTALRTKIITVAELNAGEINATGANGIYSATNITADGTVDCLKLTTDEMDVNGNVDITGDVDIDGDLSVTGDITGVTDLSADNVIIDSLTVNGNISATGDISCATLTVNSDEATWQSYTARYCTLSSTYYFVDYLGVQVLGSIVTGHTDTTIHYLGKAST